MYPELVAHIRRFIEFSEEDAEKLANCFIPVKPKKKELLLEPGKLCKGNYFVIKGCMRLYFVNDKLTEQITQFGIENWWIADNDSLLSRKPSRYYLQALEDSELLLLTPQNHNKLLTPLPNFETYLRIMYEKALVASQRRVEFILCLTDEERYRMFSELNPAFIQRVPQYMLASYLGFTPQFLSRIRAKKA
ncbi:Crp/Fnr family transcriptional regulator [Mucilaginibacter limnophilus]|uniref:Crp/Fnr family transcriptional regulator n=2 Tax=Mucilaginibacter limnophilus TaxID=1932778 RepID=A0A3S2Y4C3_9SPHI|nr:Crp/Fnr family transcriptional regulator [Mucilaginibacter limnophilus]